MADLVELAYDLNNNLIRADTKERVQATIIPGPPVMFTYYMRTERADLPGLISKLVEKRCGTSRINAYVKSPVRLDHPPIDIAIALNFYHLEG
jgi:hypothetical protein